MYQDNKESSQTYWELLLCSRGAYTTRREAYTSLLCDSGGIQTHNLLIRSQMLYSVELRNLPWLLRNDFIDRSLYFISDLRVQRYGVFLKPPNFFRLFFKKRSKSYKKLLPDELFSTFCLPQYTFNATYSISLSTSAICQIGKESTKREPGASLVVSSTTSPPKRRAILRATVSPMP